MKNLLNEMSDTKLTGRRLYSVNFVDDRDIVKRRILDIGCGFGWCALNFLNRDAGSITATEITDTDLLAIRKSLKDKRLTTKVSSALDLKFPAGSFDTVVSWEVIEHIPQNTENKMFAEVYRVLKPGGVFYLSTPFNSLISRFIDPAWWLIHHRHYSESQLKLFGTDSGLFPQKIEVKGRYWEALYIMNLYFSKWILGTAPIFADYFEQKVNAEYRYPGFIGIFVKYKKLKT
jgi:ubiquinone/menaquinone biosynthesis C-methylase UbiE